MSSENSIAVSNLSKCYHIYEKPRDRLLQMLPFHHKQYFNEFWALRDISFEARKGETVGIIGRNGSGKSTLLQLICGTLNPTAGHITVKGRVAALLELGSGFNPEFTGRENIYLNAALLGLTKKQIGDRFDQIVDFADIGEFIDQPVKTYSSGMYVRLAFSIAAHVDADILIIDEALAVGDALFTQKCMRFLRNFKEHGTLLFVSHDIGAITSLCDRAIWLHRGDMRAIGSSKDITEGYLASLYDVEQQPSEETQPSEEQRTNQPDASAPLRDMRTDLINSSMLRNDIKVFRFEEMEGGSFGLGGATITSVTMRDSNGNSCSYIVGGEAVTLRIEASVSSELDQPIVGFSLKDRLGQVLFGDNTFLSHHDGSLTAHSGEILVAEFAFNMPILPNGDFSISAAIANGTQDEHVQHHWMHDALVLKSLSTSVSTGLVGIPIRDIRLFTESHKKTNASSTPMHSQ